ncbi:MAG: LptF/LptG family permease [Candidatus Omnitrophica bacterium]|nr:LptF/LptG family permease [Candidatus Omnitrophota bacterium]MCM8801921.1 LptF/LptG family permease [Candidatus Omnitrophota bacterium]
MKFKTKYIFKGFLINFFFSFFILLFIFMLKSFFQIFDLIIKGSFSFLPLLKFFVFTILTSLEYVIPLTILVSSMSFFSTLHSDRELQVFAFSGVSNHILIKPLIIFSIIFTLFLFYFNLFILPCVRFVNKNIIHQLKIRNPLSIIIEKEIIKDIPNITIYIEKVFRNFNLKNISITKRGEDSTVFLKSEKGYVFYKPDENKLIFILENGNLLNYTENSINSVDFEKYEFNIQLTEEFKKTEIEPDIFELNFFDLKKNRSIEAIIELHERYVYSLTPLVLLFLGCGIGMNLKQKNKILYLGIGGFISIIFFELLMAGEIMVRKFSVPYPIYLPVLFCVLLTKKFWK